jgi:hypothetical protein
MSINYFSKSWFWKAGAYGLEYRYQLRVHKTLMDKNKGPNRRKLNGNPQEHTIFVRQDIPDTQNTSHTSPPSIRRKTWLVDREVEEPLLQPPLLCTESKWQWMIMRLLVTKCYVIDDLNKGWNHQCRALLGENRGHKKNWANKEWDG